MNNEQKLKLCPGCGGEASANGVQRWSSNPDHCWSDGTTVLEAFFCNCLDCNWTNKGCFGGFQTRQQAIDHWNTRPLETQMYEALKATLGILIVAKQLMVYQESKYETQAVYDAAKKALAKAAGVK